MYCTKCGKPMSDDAKFCAGCGAPAGGAGPGPSETLGEFFASLESEVLRVTVVAEGRFEFSGEHKLKTLLSRTTVRYQAIAVVDSATQVVQWWEKLSESSFGVAPADFGASAETRRQKGQSVEIRKSVRTAGGGYAYHFGDLRAVVENEAQRRGWSLKVLVARPKA